MDSTRKVGRKFVKNRAEVAFTAKEDCIVQIWQSSIAANGGRATPVFFELEKDRCTLAEGIPLPVDGWARLRVAAEESIWVITLDEALFGWSVERWLDQAE